MMKLKITFFLFTVFLFGAVAPKAFLELRPENEDLNISWPKISFQTPEFHSRPVQERDDSRFEKLSQKLTSTYQKAVYAQWQKTKPREKEQKLVQKVASRPQAKTAQVKAQARYTKQPTYRYRKVEGRSGEINDQELVHHYGFKVKRPKVASWSMSYDASSVATTLDSLKEEESSRKIAQQEVDEVEVRQASVVENQDQEKADENEYSVKEMDDETWEEELVMIDYSDDSDSASQDRDQAQESGPEPGTELEGELTTQEAMQLLSQEQSSPGPEQTNNTDVNVTSMSDDLTQADDIPASVMSAISREMSKSSEEASTVAAVDTQKTDYSKKVAPPAPRPKPPAEKLGTQKAAGRSLNKVSIHEVMIGQKNTMREMRNFEFFAETLYGETYTDDSDGEVVLDFDLNSSMGVLRGTILKHGYMRTKVDLVLESGRFDVQVPMIEQDTFARFLDDEAIYGRGGYVLVRLPQRADSAEIDAGYEAKIYLDEKFNVVEEDDYFEFILFAGVDPGNILISYENINEKVADKISHVVEDEVLFESGIIIESEQVSFSLEEKNMLSRKNSSVDIHPDQINYFNRRTQASQQAVSNYSIQTPLRALGMRDYLEMRHTQLPIFVGLWSNHKVELPSENFAYYIMESHQLNSLENACMVQINLSKPLRDAQFFGETKRGPMGVVQSYLDEDGEFNYDPSEMATHIFLVGDLQGTISGKLEYADGSHDFIQTFCSNDTYLVEQL